MANLNLLTTHNMVGFSGPAVRDSTMSERATVGLATGFEGSNFNAAINLDAPLFDRNQEIKKRFGKSVEDLTGIKRETKAIDYVPFVGDPMGTYNEWFDKVNPAIDDIIQKGREKDPDAWKDIKTTAEIEQPFLNSLKYTREQNEKLRRSAPGFFSRMGTDLIGGLGDPLNAASMAVNLPGGMIKGTGTQIAMGILKTSAAEGALNASIEALQIGGRSRLEKKLGNEYGTAQIAQDLGMAFGAGALLSGTIKALPHVARKGFDVSVQAKSAALRKIGDLKTLPQTVRDAAKYVSRETHIQEKAPYQPKAASEEFEHRQAFDKVHDDINNYKRPAPEIKGATKIITPRNELEIEVKPRLVDLEDLVTSDKKEFDQSLQPRDRAGRIASDVRINEIAARLDPAQLADSRVSNTGAPVVGPDMMVESGNGRIMALRKVYADHPERAAAYRDFLESQGYKTKGMKNPVLVRQRLSELTPDQRKSFVIFSNEDVADRLSVTERAAADAKLIPPAIMKAYAGGDITLARNANFVRGFIDQAVSSSERNAIITPTGELSQEGAKRINAALLSRAYNDPNIVQKIMEDPDNDIKTIGRVLMDTSGQWSQMRLDIQDGITPPIYDITQDLMDAVRTIIHARATNRPMSDFTGQSALFADTELTAETRAILAGWYDENGIRPLGYDRTKEFIDHYVEQVNKIQEGPGLFVQEPLSPFQILNALLERQGKSLAALSSSARKARPLNETSATPAPRDQALPSHTSDMTPPSSFLRKRAMTPPSKKTGLSNSISEIPPLVKVYQTSNDLSTIIKKIKKLEPDFSSYLNYITKGVKDSQVFGVRIKDKESLDLKIARGKEPSKISDYLGGRIVVDTKEALDHVLHNIRQTGDIIEFDDFMDGSRSSGYRAVHMQIKSSKGVSAELQIQPAPIRAVQGAAHKLYKKWQNVDKDIMSAKEAKSFSKDMDKIKKMFDDAWAEWDNGGNAAPSFDENAYRLREYRNAPPEPVPEVKPSDRLAASQERFSAMVKENPDMLITAEDGTTIRLSDYAARMKEDEKIIEAITTCRVA